MLPVETKPDLPPRLIVKINILELNHGLSHKTITEPATSTRDQILGFLMAPEQVIQIEVEAEIDFSELATTTQERQTEP